MKEEWEEKASFLDKSSAIKRDYEAPTLTRLFDDEKPEGSAGDGADGAGTTGFNFGS